MQEFVFSLATSFRCEIQKDSEASEGFMAETEKTLSCVFKERLCHAVFMAALFT